MQTYQPSILARPDTLLGICEAIGGDLGINPIWLRVSLAMLVFFNLGAAVAIYLAAGAVVLASRLIYRSPRKLMPQSATEAAPAEQAAPVPALAHAENDDLVMAAAA